MRILSPVTAVVLALCLSASTSWASGSALGNGKTPAHAAASDKTKPGSKKGDVNVGSKARQEALKKSQSQTKSAKGKASTPSKKTVKKKS